MMVQPSWCQCEWHSIFWLQRATRTRLSACRKAHKPAQGKTSEMAWHRQALVLGLYIKKIICSKAEVHRSLQHPSAEVTSHTTRVPPVGFELAIDGIQFHVIANLD